MQQFATLGTSIHLRLKGDEATVADLQVAFSTVARELSDLGLPIKFCFISDEDFRAELMHKEPLTDRAARSKVFVTLQECEIESESTWDDSDQRGSTNNFVAKEAAHCEKEEETWDESWP